MGKLNFINVRPLHDDCRNTLYFRKDYLLVFSRFLLYFLNLTCFFIKLEYVASHPLLQLKIKKLSKNYFLSQICFPVIFFAQPNNNLLLCRFLIQSCTCTANSDTTCSREVPQALQWWLRHEKRCDLANLVRRHFKSKMWTFLHIITSHTDVDKKIDQNSKN